MIVSGTFLLTIRPIVSAELRRWERRAASIPDGILRAAALDTLARERFNAEGAALFATLVPRRAPAVVRLLVAYQVLWDYLDTVTEWEVPDHVATGRSLHRALADALDPSGKPSDYYAGHPLDDGGYMRSLVAACQRECAQLPSYEQVSERVLHDARRAQVQAINHDTDPVRRANALRCWASVECQPREDVRWFELTAAAAASLHIHALLALAAEPRTSVGDAHAVWTAYFPWVSATSTMLDSLVDRGADLQEGSHVYVGYYEADELAERVPELVARASSQMRRLRRPDRHGAIVAAMVAMYLSTPSALSPGAREVTRAAVAGAGRSAALLLPVMRLWRHARYRKS